MRRLTCCDRGSGYRNACRNAWKSGKLKGESEGSLLTIGSFETSCRKGRYVKLTLTCTMSARATSGLLRSGFWLQKRLQKRLEVRKTERGERGLSFGYRIVENVQREEEIRAKNKKRAQKESRRLTCCDRFSSCRNACRNAR